MKVLYSPDTTELKNKKVIFLAGPIKYTYDWQDDVIYELENCGQELPNVIIANPRRLQGTIPINQFKKQDHNIQVKWETKHLAEAAKTGLITFFLCNQETNDPNQTYARTTRFELGEWFGELKNKTDIKLIIGYDDEFAGLEYILDRFKFYLEKYPQKAKQLIVCKESGIDEFVETILNHI